MEDNSAPAAQLIGTSIGLIIALANGLLVLVFGVGMVLAIL